MSWAQAPQCARMEGTRIEEAQQTSEESATNIFQASFPRLKPGLTHEESHVYTMSNVCTMSHVYNTSNVYTIRNLHTAHPLAHRPLSQRRWHERTRIVIGASVCCVVREGGARKVRPPPALTPGVDS